MKVVVLAPRDKPPVSRRGESPASSRLESAVSSLTSRALSTYPDAPRPARTKPPSTLKASRRVELPDGSRPGGVLPVLLQVATGLLEMRAGPEADALYEGRANLLLVLVEHVVEAVRRAVLGSAHALDAVVHRRVEPDRGVEHFGVHELFAQSHLVAPNVQIEAAFEHVVEALKRREPLHGVAEELHRSGPLVILHRRALREHAVQDGSRLRPWGQLELAVFGLFCQKPRDEELEAVSLIIVEPRSGAEQTSVRQKDFRLVWCVVEPGLERGHRYRRIHRQKRLFTVFVELEPWWSGTEIRHHGEHDPHGMGAIASRANAGGLGHTAYIGQFRQLLSPIFTPRSASAQCDVSRR